MSPAARAKAERRAASGLGKSSTLRRNNSSTSLHSDSQDSQESNDRGSDRESDKGSFRSSSGGEDSQEESFKAGPEGTSEYAKSRDELGDESFRGAGGKGGGSFRGRRHLSKKHIDASAFPFIDAALLENAELFKVARHLVHRGLNEQRCIKEVITRIKENTLHRAMREAFACFRPERAFVPIAQLARLAVHLTSPPAALGIALAAAGMHHSD